jgi:hypothetical protein
MTKKLAPAAVHCLKEALTHAYWYKSDLRSFLTSSLSDPSLLSRLNWNQYKVGIVSDLVDFMIRNEVEYQGELLRLMSDVSAIKDFSHLERLEDGRAKSTKAMKAVDALRKQVASHEELAKHQQEADARREQARARRMKEEGFRSKLEEVKSEYYRLLGLPPAKRGYALEKLMYSLFELFDLDPKVSFKILGEQIDGSFSFEGTDYLFEAKWEDKPTARADLDAFDGKVRRKLENTLGLFLAINGFVEDSVKAYSSGRSLMILMDGADLMAVLEGRIDLVTLLLRKRRHASQTGNIYLRIHELLA